MDKKLKIYTTILVVIICFVIYLDSNKPKPIDWLPTFSINDKIPLGLYVFDNELQTLLKNQKIEKFNSTPYEFLNKNFDDDSLVNNYKKKGTILIINNICDIDNESLQEMGYFTDFGNSVFISSKIIPNALLDSLKIKMNSEFKLKDKTYNWLANRNLGSKKYYLKEGIENNYFAKFDTLTTTILGYQSGDSTRVNFIKVKYKNGNILLHTQPAAFSNFHLLKKNNYQYAEKVLSYLPKDSIYWCVKDQDGSLISDSPMRFIMSKPALQWVWYLFLAGMFVFILFNIKRKQRIIPVIDPLPNTTIEFTKTIGNLYYQEGDYDNIIRKKIIYFLEKIRNEYFIDTSKLDDDFVKKFHIKSNKKIDDIQKSVYLINNYQKIPHQSIEDDLIKINDAIEKVI